MSCTNCNEQYVGSVIDFKKRFRIPKKDRCGVARHFTNKCRDPQNPHAFLKIQPTEQFSIKEESNICLSYIYIYIYVIMKTMCPPGYHHNGFVATPALGHMMYGS